MTDAMELDAVIFGGGAAGLWTLDELVRAGRRCLLLEAHELGAGQTVASQGIIHGGMKYTLSGWLSPAARAIADMPQVWKHCLAGEARPNLSATRIRAHACLLWQTTSLKSRLGMIGARAGLRVAPHRLADHERPAILARCPGVVARLDEQVIEPWSLITDLSEQHRTRVLKIDARSGLEIARGDLPHDSPATEGLSNPPLREATLAAQPQIESVRLINPETGDPLDLRPRVVVFAAGAGNGELRSLCGLSPATMQRRPLHMVMLRSERDSLAAINGHCTDGMATRVTITSTRDFSDRLVWQIGGQIAERGVELDSPALIRHARGELRAVLPGIDLRSVEWAAYRVDRAEAANAGSRPNDATIVREGNVITAWPTKLALVPRLAQQVRDMVGPPAAGAPPVDSVRAPKHWPRPAVALPPWETTPNWTTFD